MKTKPFPGAALKAVATILILAAGGFAPSATAQLSGLLSQGVTMTMNSSSGGRTSTSTLYFSANATKTVTSEGQDSIIRFDQEKIITVDHKKKTYSEMTFQQMQAMIDSLSKGLAGLSDDKEAMEAIKKMMGGGGTAAPLTVTRQGPGDTIAGYSTTKYLIAGPMDIEVWAAPDLKVPTAYYDAMRVRIPANPIFDMGKMYDAFKQIDGWPLKHVMTMKMMGRSMTTSTEVTAVQKGPIPPSTFEIPAGYRLVQEKF